MSRVGKMPIHLPQGVQIRLDGSILSVEGQKGTLCQSISKGIKLEIGDNNIIVTRTSENKKLRSLQGLTRSLIANMVTGVTQGFSKQLEIVGVGYRAELSNNTITFLLGFSHPVNFTLPEGVQAKVEKQVITLEGIDKGKVGQTAAKIRSLKKPDAYKGKGIRYLGEVVKTKVGKTGAK